MENERKIAHDFEPINCINSYNKMIKKQKDKEFKKLCDEFDAQLKKGVIEREKKQHEDYNHGKFY